MIKRMTIVVILYFCSGALCATPPAQERYLQANILYQQGEFQKAYDLYQGIQYKSPELLINMGNAAFELGHIPEALVRWRQAQVHVKPTDYNMLEDRIAKVQQEHDGMYHSGHAERIARHIDVLMRFVPHKVWQLLFLILVCVGFFLVSWVERCCWGRIVVWFLALLVVVAFLMVRYTVQNQMFGFVMRDTHAYVNKDSQARIKASMRAGQEVEIRAIHDTWYLITDGIVTGWVMQNDLQLV